MKKERYNIQSQCDEDIMAITDEAILRKNGFIKYHHEIQLEMQNNGIFIALSQVHNYCQ